ncbi:MAG: TfoX/Sxy family protein [Anaerolineales bacterium]|nr:TfoX/Sxy family protein [Anaerolineales bacterium]
MMATSPEYAEYIMDLLGPIEPGAKPRKMFGGVGVFLDGIMFGLITSADVFHLRVDEVNRPDFETLDQPQFMNMPYFEAPAGILDDQDELQAWVEKAIAASRRADAKKRR